MDRGSDALERPGSFGFERHPPEGLSSQAETPEWSTGAFYSVMRISMRDFLKRARSEFQEFQQSCVKSDPLVFRNTFGVRRLRTRLESRGRHGALTKASRWRHCRRTNGPLKSPGSCGA